MAKVIAKRIPGTKKYKIQGFKKKSSPTGSLARAINRVINRKAETKMVAWYNGQVPSNGTYAQANYVLQNPVITSNTTDILRLIPRVYQGLGDNQRVGELISPTSLNVKGTVMLNIPNVSSATAGITSDIYVVIYVLQHVTLKSYAALTASNDFTQLLRTGEVPAPGTNAPPATVSFQGKVTDAQLPVDNSYYKLLKKKKYRLRYAGKNPASGGDLPNNTWLSVSNCVSYRAEFSMNLSKFLPAKLKYPDTVDVSGNPTGTDPTNSSIFMCMGCYQGNGTIDNTWQFDQQYTSHMTYKDM